MSQRIGSLVVDQIVTIARKHATPQAAMKAIEAYAAGKDGVLGTGDDRLGPETLVLLKTVVESGVAQGIVRLLFDQAAKAPGCFGCFTR